MLKACKKELVYAYLMMQTGLMPPQKRMELRGDIEHSAEAIKIEREGPPPSGCDVTLCEVKAVLRQSRRKLEEALKSQLKKNRQNLI